QLMTSPSARTNRDPIVSPGAPRARFALFLQAAALLSAGLLLASGCIGRPDFGQRCAEEGATKVADDGCNSCLCKNRRWNCTTADSGDGDGNGNDNDDGECAEGATKKVECNTCLCQGGSWTCTRIACSDTCREGETATMEGGCGECTCEQGSWSCPLEICSPECQEGDTRSADD